MFLFGNPLHGQGCRTIKFHRFTIFGFCRRTGFAYGSAAGQCSGFARIFGSFPQCAAFGDKVFVIVEQMLGESAERDTEAFGNFAVFESGNMHGERHFIITWQ